MRKASSLDRFLAQLAAKGSQCGGAELYAKLLDLDAKLVAKGFPPMSPWWRAALKDFYLSGKRNIVLRVGRRGGKSSTLCRVAVTEVLYGNHDVPPGDVGYWIFVSVSMREANERLGTIRDILDAIGVEYSPADSGLRIAGTNRGFRVFPATIGGVSGFTSIGFVCDEMTKWKDKDSGANPAAEVVRSLKPTMATQRNAKRFYSSSPFSTLDLHYEMFEAGNTNDQMVACAPTWVANPSLTEQDTHEDEPDEETWSREYAAIPAGSGASNFFDAFVVDDAIQEGAMPLTLSPGWRQTAGGDFAFERNASALAIVHNSGEKTKQRFRLADLLELKPAPNAPLLPSEVIGAFAARMRQHGVRSLRADPHYRMAVVEHLSHHKLLYVDAPGGQQGKAETYVRARVLLAERRLAIPSEPRDLVQRLVRQLKEVQRRYTASGGVTILQREDPSGRHGDLVSALVLATWQRAGEEYEAPTAEQPVPGTPEWHTARAMADAAAYRKRVFELAAREKLAAGRRILRRIG